MALKLNNLTILESREELATLPEGKLLINTVNAHSFNTAQKDELFAEALAKGDVLIPDGASIVWACKWLNAKSHPKMRCAGWDLFAYEMKKLNDSLVDDKTKTEINPSFAGDKQEINPSAGGIDKKALDSSEDSANPLAANACDAACEQGSQTASQSLSATHAGDDESKEKKSCGEKEVFDLEKDFSSDGSMDSTGSLHVNHEPLTFNHKPLTMNRKPKVMFMGSSEKVLRMVRAQAAVTYPNLEIVTYSPPYKPEFSDEDNAAIIKAINEADPDLLWIGMTAPKQEKWTYSHWQKLDIHCHVGTIGAVFDFFAGTYQRAPEWFQQHGLEWLYRLLKEPRRMWRRYVLGNPLFVWNVMKEKMFG